MESLRGCLIPISIGVLGLLLPEAGDDLLDSEVEGLIAERTEARKMKNWDL